MPSVLLCDDDRSTRLMLRRLLEKQNYTIAGEAASGVEAIRLVDETHPDIVLLDIGMPRGHGLTILPVLRELDENLCIIMLTGDSRAESVRTAIGLGAKGYIAKESLSRERLFSALENAVGASPTEPAQARTVAPAPAPAQRGGTVVEPEPGPSASFPAVYITGGLHNGQAGSIYSYHPLTATPEKGAIAAAMREIARHPNYFSTLFRRMTGFREISSVLFQQLPSGDIAELLMNSVPSDNAEDAISFAYRIHEAGEEANLLLGLASDGSPLRVTDLYSDNEETNHPKEYPLNAGDDSLEAGGLLDAFNDLTLEAFLFLSAFNLAEMLAWQLDDKQKSAHSKRLIRRVREYAVLQHVPKAVLFGGLGILALPAPEDRNLAVTVSLWDNASNSEERADMHFWMDPKRLSRHLQFQQNCWRVPAMPLMRLEGFGIVSLLSSLGANPRYGVSQATELRDIYDAKSYTGTSLEELTQELPSLRLPDLMRPLLVNTMLARQSELRVETRLKSPLDDSIRGRYAQRQMSGTGLSVLEKMHPRLFTEARRALQDKNIDKTDPEYANHLVHEVALRQNVTNKLGAKSVDAPTLDEDEVIRRRRVSDQQRMTRKYERKYGD